MSAQAVPAEAPPSASPASPGRARRRQRFHLFNISTKFVLSTVLLFFAVMSAVGYSLYVQQRQALTREVLSRGATIAENLAKASADFLAATPPDILTGMALAKGAVEQQKVDMSLRQGHDLANPVDLLAGITAAFDELRVTVPSLLEQNLESLAGRSFNLGLVASSAAAPSAENEGIAEAIIVDNSGVIQAHYLGTSELGKTYETPRIVRQADAETPYPVYEMESAVDGRRYVRRLYQLKQDIVFSLDGVDKKLGTVYVGEDEDLVNSVVFSGTMKLAAIGIAAVAIGILFTYFLVALMTAPIGRLVKGVLATADGDFDTRVKVGSRDELGELTYAFNTMAVSLSQNEMLKGAFTRYVSDAALKQILADPGKTGLHSRRVMATIFTSDVRGFTSMSETLEPEQVVQVINTYLSLQTEIILKHGGVVDKFIGDATIGVWGKETPSADDAINGVRAAYEVQQAIEAMNAARESRGEIVKQIGIGVNTGEVVSGNMGSNKKMEYTVTGEHVIFSDQICAECPGGKVWISQSTYDLVKDQVLAEPATLKGRAHQSTVWQVNGFQ